LRQSTSVEKQALRNKPGRSWPGLLLAVAGAGEELQDERHAVQLPQARQGGVEQAREVF
jgi:hypothetical protein